LFLPTAVLSQTVSAVLSMRKILQLLNHCLDQAE
jgi:hypothetical protein